MAISSISSVMASLTCRLCWENIAPKKATSLFTTISLQQGWASRISALLQVPVKPDDKLPKHACSKCINRVKTLEKAAADLSSFKRSVRSVMEHHAGCLKRTKETTSDVGVSPDTLRERPQSKVA